jgi:hypothetical protein
MRFAAVLGCALLGASAAQALPAVQIDPSEFLFALQASNGPVNPGVEVGFNPQPDPPGEPLTLLDLLDSTRPVLTVPASGERSFRFLFALGTSGDVSPFELVLEPPPDPDRLRIEARDRNGKTLLTIDAFVAFSDGGHLDPASIVGFDPQPDPPGAADSIGIDFSFFAPAVGAGRGVGPFATLSFEMHDAAGGVFSFKQVPEPATLMSVAMGLALLAGRRSRS